MTDPAPPASTGAPVLVEPARTVALRHRVLRPHQTPAEVAAAMDAPDAFAVAVLAGEEVVCCALAAPEPCPDPVGEGDPWRLRGMATDPQHRGRGLGAAVLDRVLTEVVARGGGLVWCNARTPARGLYDRAGFAVVGDPWDDAEIGPHVRMWRTLPAGRDTAAAPDRGRMTT